MPGAQVERVGEGIKLVLGENSVRFDTNKSTLTATAKANLDKLVPVFKSYADTDIVIYGYTDSTGSAEYNLNLSQQRANSVEKYLESKGLNMARFKISFFIMLPQGTPAIRAAAAVLTIPVAKPAITLVPAPVDDF